MVTFTRFALLIGLLIFSSMFLSSFIWSIRLTLNLFDGVDNGFDWGVFVHTLIWVSSVMGGSILIISTPFGDKIMGLFFAMRKISLREEKQINPIIENLKEKYQELHGETIAIKPYMMDLPNINGMALGRQSVAVTSGLLKVAKPEEISAILAHEIGHIHHKDGFFNIAMFIASFPTYYLNFLLKAVFMITPKPSLMPSGGQDMGWGLKAFVFLMALFLFFPFIIMWALSFPMIWLSNALEIAVQWPIEYRADKFAADMGFAPAMITLLERVEDEDVRGEEGFLAKYFHSHPPTALRIDRLERGLPI